MSRPRVLVVDDDVSIRRFVSLALEELEIDLLLAGSVAEALALLRAGGPVQALLTDLMMPGASGFDLLQALADEPALRGQATLVALSAGLDASTRQRLDTLGVPRALHKPISIGELEACVRAAAGLDAAEARPLAAGPAAGAPGTDPALDAAEADAVHSHFGGDSALFLAFRASCRLQFSQDVLDGSVAAARRDTPALRLLSHSLKSVLATLGRPQLAEQARRLEAASAAGDAAAAVSLWEALRDDLSAEATPPDK
jgi:CheY-like chemotaxis protein